MHRRAFATVLSTAIALTGLISAPASAADSVTPSLPRTATSTQQWLNDLIHDTGATSLSVAIIDGRRTALALTAGRIDATGTKPTASTAYGIGSVSKMLAAVAVLQLVDAGSVSLDAPVTDYVTDFRMASPEYRQITVRMLLNHSAGLPGTDYTNGFTTSPYLSYADQVLHSLADQRLKTTPGSMSVYCNDCFTLAGILVERMTGQSFPDYVTQHILHPLGMTRSGYGLETPAPGDYAPVLTNEGVAMPHEITNVWASGGLISTPTDMGRLAAMLMNGGAIDGTRVLSSSAVRAMAASQLPTTLIGAQPPQVAYGLGWDDVHEPGLAAAGVHGWVKGGDTGQYHAAMTLAPDQNLAAIVIAAGTTVSSGPLETLAQQVVLSALAEKNDIDAVPGQVSTKTPPPTRPTSKQLADVTGIYVAQGLANRVTALPDGSLELAMLQDGVWVTSPVGPITMRSDGRFWSDATGSAIGLTRGWGRTYLVLDKLSRSGQYRESMILGQKVSTGGVADPAWAARIGQTWIMANELATSQTWDTALPTLTLQAIPGLDGYAWVKDTLAPSPVDISIDSTHGYTFLAIPQMQGRDLNDLVVLNNTLTEPWLQFGTAVYQPLDSVLDIPTSATTDVTIEANGYAQWRRIPTDGTLRIAGPGVWKAYNESGAPAGSGPADGTAVRLTAGALLALFATPGSTVQVSYVP